MDIIPVPKIILVQVVPFAVLLVVLNLLVFQPLLAYIKERNRRMVGFSAEAKELEADAEQQRTAVESRLAEARTVALASRMKIVQQANEQEQKLIAEARSNAEKQVAQFRQELSGVQKEASQRLRGEAESLSTEIASQILGRVLN